MSTVSGGTWRALNRFGIPPKSEPKPVPGFKTYEDPAHVNEDTEQPCQCGISAAQAERAYYDCTRITKPERKRRAQAKDYALWAGTPTGQRIRAANRGQARPVEVVKPESTDLNERQRVTHLALCSGEFCERAWCPRGQTWRQSRPEWRARVDEGAKVVVQAGTGPETATGKDGAKQGEGYGAASVSVLPSRDRTSTGETNATDGTNTGSVATTTTDGKARRTVAERIERLRQRLRSSEEPERQTDRTAATGADGSTVLQTLQATDTARVGARHEAAVATPKPKRRGRPKVHKDKREKDRKNSRAYRQRRQRK